MKSTLSEVTSKLWVLVNRTEWAHEEVDMVNAPSECHSLVTKSVDKKVKRIFEDSGWSIREWMDTLNSRVSYKWIYSSGLVSVIPESLIDGGRKELIRKTADGGKRGSCLMKIRRSGK